MLQVLIGDGDPGVIKKLKLRARRPRRSLQAELKDVLEQASAASPADVLARIEPVRAMFRRRRFTDSAVLIRRDPARGPSSLTPASRSSGSCQSSMTTPPRGCSAPRPG